MSLDFYRLSERKLEGKKEGEIDIFPDFRVVRSCDLMVDGKAFYAIWDAEKNMWSQDEYDVQRLIDQELEAYVTTTEPVSKVHKKFLGNWSTNSWMSFRNYVTHVSANRHQLDENLTFANSEVKKEDYVSKRLPYAVQSGDISAYEELFSTLYAPEEKAKLEWAIGSIIAGDSKHIQKYFVLYGDKGTGKSTWLLLLQALTQGYFATFDAKQLTGNNNGFAASMFASNPLVVIQHDGDLSGILDNTLLNSIVSHEIMTINEKYKASYDMAPGAMLFMGTNKPVKITDAKSGQLRRMIDVNPTGQLVSARRYQILMQQMLTFELGAIAAHCLEVYRSMGKDYYAGYIPERMMLQTDVFFNFVEWHWDDFKALSDGISLTKAYDLYKEYCKDNSLEWQMPRFKFREELKNYFDTFQESHVTSDGDKIRGWYTGFNADKFKSQKHVEDEDAKVFSLVMDETESLLDELLKDAPAQYAVEGTDDYLKFWDQSERVDSRGRKYIPSESRVVSTTLADLDTHREHYVKVPEQLITIDFDLTAPDGSKSAERNLEAASSWPSSYGEFSKSESGIHLEYWYDGDVSELSRVYDDGIEIKVYTGNASLRRKLSRCNNVPIAHLAVGSLPLKEKKPVLDGRQIASEKTLREQIERNLRKEIHPGTKSSVDFIHKILEDAYLQGLEYDVTDMRNRIMAFANNSTNQSLAALKVVNTMRFASEISEKKYEEIKEDEKDIPLVFFDVEVFPNLFMICWKYEGTDNVTTMINPSAAEVEKFMKFRLIGYNNRRYDNHIIFAASLGYDNARLYRLSQKIINNVPNSAFGQAYDVSYTDIYDFANVKQSLKKWEIDLGIPHKELNLPWDQPVDPSLWEEVRKYCENDVRATEAVFHARKEDWIARQILSDISGLSTNASTQQHTARIVFGDNRRPQEEFIYTDLSSVKEFKGYSFVAGKSTYRGEVVGEGGYVYAEPGMYENVVSLDVASMHPTSIEQLDLFGPYTKKFSELKSARIAIKRKDFETAGAMFGGRLAKFITDTDGADALAYALKIVINIVYGLTAARFDNSFRDPRNIDNIVAKRGALFMVNCKFFVQELGYQVIHIKTDSIKIVVPKGENTATIIDAVMEYGDLYGYEFEHEGTYEKICLVNDAVFVAKFNNGRKPAYWTATGAQFQHPYVFKTLFTHEPITFADKCETKSVTTSLWLDFNKYEEPTFAEDISKRDETLLRREALNLHKERSSAANDEKKFVGKSGVFCPIEPGWGGGTLQREKDGKFFAATGSTGYEWLTAERVQELDLESHIDMSFYQKLVDEAVEDISVHGDFEAFVS